MRYPASRGYVFAVWARAKSSLWRQTFNCLSRCDWQAKLIVRSVVKWREFHGIKKNATTLICYARLTQCSKPVKKRKKNRFFYFIRPELNGSRQRLLFARQLTQRKCSLCSQVSNTKALTFNLTLFYISESFPYTRCLDFCLLGVKKDKRNCTPSWNTAYILTTSIMGKYVYWLQLL